jgi:capsid protein
MSLSEVQRSLGYIPEEVMAEVAKDKENAESLGLELSVFQPPRNAGGTQTEEPADSEGVAVDP